MTYWVRFDLASPLAFARSYSTRPSPAATHRLFKGNSLSFADPINVGVLEGAWVARRRP